MLREDGEVTFYQLVDRADDYNDGDWFVRNLDNIIDSIPAKHRYVEGKKADWSTSWEEVPCVRAFTAEGSWQQTGYMAATKKKHAKKFLKLARKYNPDSPNLAIRRVTLKQTTTVLTTEQL